MSMEKKLHFIKEFIGHISVTGLGWEFLVFVFGEITFAHFRMYFLIHSIILRIDYIIQGIF